MNTLIHYRLCPASRAIRIVLAELGVEAELAEEKPWEWRQEFLALNPNAQVPVIVAISATWSESSSRASSRAR